MKNPSTLLLVGALALALCAPASLLGADARTQAAREAAEREAIKNDLKRVQADVAELIESLNTQLRKVAELQETVKTQAEDIRRLRGDLAQERASNATRYATIEDIKSLTEKLQELDGKRQKDADLIVKELGRVNKDFQTAIDQFDKRSELLNKRLSNVERGAGAKPGPSGAGVKPSPPPTDQKGWYHTIQAGEFVGRVIAAYNEAWAGQGGSGKITLEAVKKANPKVDIDRVQVGQEIFLPQPGQ